MVEGRKELTWRFVGKMAAYREANERELNELIAEYQTTRDTMGKSSQPCDAARIVADEECPYL